MEEVIALVNERGLIPMIDIAYQGFGDGLEEDALGVRLVASSCPEVLIAASCSKNFGIYRERTGLLMAVSNDAGAQGLNQGTLAFLNRQNYSFPPDHGARLVTMILNDDALRADWAAELEETRLGMLGLRQQLADELQRPDWFRPFRFHRPAPRYVLAAGDHVRPGREDARRQRHLHGRRQPSEHCRPQRSDCTNPRQSDCRRRRLSLKHSEFPKRAPSRARLLFPK